MSNTHQRNGSEVIPSDPHRKAKLLKCEMALAEHMEEFVRVGLALKEIRDDKLYVEAGYETFEAYCKGKWEFSYSYAYRVIESADVRLILPTLPSGQGREWTERSVREIRRLDSPAKQKGCRQSPIPYRPHSFTHAKCSARRNLSCPSRTTARQRRSLAPSVTSLKRIKGPILVR